MTSPNTATCPACSAPLGEGNPVCPRCGADTAAMSASRLFVAPAPVMPDSPAAAGTTGAEADATAPPIEPPLAPISSPWDTVLERLRDATAGEFEVGRELGRGGMAAVFLGRDLALNRRVAIKVMAPGLMMGEGMVERFRQEAITIANLSHANIVSIYAVRQLEDLHFFVMQFVAGQALDTVLRTHGRLPVPVVRAILFQVGDALDYAHLRGVVHRDVKPGNILMSGDGNALVTDFGIAKVAQGPTQTQTGMVVGTPTYMSPEQCYAQPLDGRSDQYSLGVVAFELLAGVPPFTGSPFELMRGHTTEAPPELRTHRADVPPAMEAAIRRMLSKSPGDRFPSFGEALAAMGATAIPSGDPLRRELVRLAAVEERRTVLGSLLHTPSPAPLSGGGRTGRRGDTRAPDSGGGTAPQTAVAVAPIPSSLEPGDTLPLHARVLGESDGIALTWSVDTPTVARVNAVTGELTALAPGSGHVLATVGSVTERTPFVVVPPRVVSVRVEQPSDPLRVGDVVQLRARLLDKRQHPLDRPVQWRAVGRSLALTPGSSASCTAQCIGEGPTAVTATCEGVSGTDVLQVGPARADEAHAAATHAAEAHAARAPFAAAGSGAAPTVTLNAAASPRRPVWLIGLTGLAVTAAAVFAMNGGFGFGSSAGRGPVGADEAPKGARVAADSPTVSVSGTERTASDAPVEPEQVGDGSAPDSVAGSTSVAAAVNDPARARAGASANAPEKAPANGPANTPPADPVAAPNTDRTAAAAATPPASRPAAPPAERRASANRQQQAEQDQLAREARALIEAFAAAVETRQVSRVRGVYPGLSSGNAETFETMFRGTTAVRMRVGEIVVVNGGRYDPAIGARTFLTAEVTFEFIPVGGGTLPPTDDVLPVTVQRTDSGWRLEQIGLP